MATLNPYLNFQGNTEDAFNFYKSVFGGEFVGLMRFGSVPGADKLPAAERNKIMHIALPIGQNLLMATDMLESMGQRLERGNAASVSVDVASDEEGQRIYNGLLEGGQASMPYAPVLWGGKWGMLTDKFGVQWMVSYKDAHPTP